MKIKDSVVFITGANRGLGLAFAKAALAAGARKVYGAARDPGSIDLPGVCLLYTSPSPRDGLLSRMPSSA